MSAHPDPRFERFAANEPYFSVLAAPQYLRANFSPDREHEFFQTGQDFVDWLFDVIDQRLGSNFSPMSTLEYGCGVGRLAIPLSKRPGSVTAVDRSPAMLSVARDQADRHDSSHVEFLSPAQLFESDRKFDLVVCVNVLQRMPPVEGLALMKQLLDRIASGGIGIFHAPRLSRVSFAVRMARSMREHSSIVNGVMNAMRRKSWSAPFIPTRLYDVGAILGAAEAASIRANLAVFDDDGEVSNLILFAERPLPVIDSVDRRGRPVKGLPALRRRENQPKVDVKTLIQKTSLEALIESAEEYFSSLKDTDQQLAKPFGSIGDAPRLLVNLSTLLDGLHLRHGDTVLEFGAGTGWVSRQLTQLGCRAILLDVSPSGLEIARELYRRLPVIGDRPAPEFLTFDGRRIPLPDASVDRILTFDAFHHVPNPDDMLREFARILKPGGIAGFSEPGARHSESPMSQFEMRTYAVVENDVDIHAIWRTARTAGFADIKVAIFNGPPFYASLKEYEDFLADGGTGGRWLTATRVFQRNVRNFFLKRAGEDLLDSRSVEALASRMSVHQAAVSVREGERVTLQVTVTNGGRARWLSEGAGLGTVRLGAHLYAATGEMLTLGFHTEPLTDPPRDVLPGEVIERSITLPALKPGRYRIELDCVAENVCWFSQTGSKTVWIDVEVG